VLLAVFSAALSAPAVAGIEYQLVEGGTVNVKSGVPTPFRLLVNCETGGGHGEGSSFASHGTITYKETVAKACGRSGWPALQTIYTSQPGFVGVDDITVYSGRAPFHFRMIVH